MESSSCNRLGPKSRNDFNRDFPFAEASCLWVLEDPDKSYNCIAWTVGITTTRLWPKNDGGRASLDDFTQFYAHFGFEPADVNTNEQDMICVFGPDQDDIKHGARFYCNEGEYRCLARDSLTWTSKMGQNYLISHWLDDLTASPYGWVQGFFRPMKAFDRMANARVAQQLQSQRLTGEEVAAVRERAARVPADVSEEFNQRYAAWVKTWDVGDLAFSSIPEDRTRSEEFRQLLGLGDAILPLLMQAMLDDTHSFALQAVQKLAPAGAVFSPDAEDPAVLGGEQLRTRQTIRNWVRSPF